MRRLMADGVVAACCFLASSTAMAANATFTIFKGSTVVASWVQDLNPIPIFWVSGEGTTIGISHPTGLVFGEKFINYFNAAYAPQVILAPPGVLGGLYDENLVDFGFGQLYTGPERRPLFALGTYPGNDEFNGGPATLVIGQPSVHTVSTLQTFNAAAPVPEPKTWAMMLIGMGAIGFGVRRRARVGVSYT